MMKSEFESLAMRKHGAEIPYNLYKEYIRRVLFEG